MKRSITAALSLLMALSVTACSSAGTPKGKDPSYEPEESSGSDNAFVFEGFTAIDTDDYSITINDLTPDNYGDFEIGVTYENRSDTDYDFKAEYIFVNNIMVPAFGMESVAAGSKADSTVSFLNEPLSSSGIKEYTDIEIIFRISDNGTPEDIGTHEVHIYPYGEDEAAVYERGSVSSDTVLVDNGDFCVAVTGYIPEDFWGDFKALFCIFNKTDRTLIFRAEDSSINGHMIDPVFVTILPGTRCTFTEMVFLQSELEENDIKGVEKIRFILQVFDEDLYSDYLYEEEFTLNVKQ